MKKSLLLLGMTLSLMTISCSKDDSTSENTVSSDVASNQKVDVAMDDIAVIADDQYEKDQTNASGRGIQDGYTSVLPDCAHVTVDASSTATHRIIHILFGGTGTGDFCVFRGHHLRGQITLTRDASPTSSTKTMTITYTDFYVDDNKLGGTTTWTRTMIGSGADERPRTTLTMTNMTLTTTDGVYTRNGSRVREMSHGFATRTNHDDDEFITAGEFNTTHPNGDRYTSLINTSAPLLNKIVCGDDLARFPVSGILILKKYSADVLIHTTNIDYGTGTCDNVAMMSIDGGAAVQITLH